MTLVLVPGDPIVTGRRRQEIDISVVIQIDRKNRLRLLGRRGDGPRSKCQMAQVFIPYNPIIAVRRRCLAIE